ncbi:MAG: hypothetical protein R6U89_00785 [Dehalococcoidia bacterium]
MEKMDMAAKDKSEGIEERVLRSRSKGKKAGILNEYCRNTG